MDRRERVGQRIIAYACAALVLCLWVAIVPAQELAGSFGDRPITLRPWMLTYNAAVLGTHLLLLAALACGAYLGMPREAPSRRLRVSTLVVLGATAMLTMLFVAWPWIAGAGPFAPQSTEVRTLRVLVFLPPLLRTIALGMVAFWVCVDDLSARPKWLVLALAALDVALCGATWISTPKAVVAMLHPCAVEPLQMLPLLLLLCWIVWRLRRDPARITSR